MFDLIQIAIVGGILFFGFSYLSQLYSKILSIKNWDIFKQSKEKNNLNINTVFEKTVDLEQEAIKYKNSKLLDIQNSYKKELLSSYIETIKEE